MRSTVELAIHEPDTLTTYPGTEFMIQGTEAPYIPPAFVIESIARTGFGSSGGSGDSNGQGMYSPLPDFNNEHTIMWNIWKLPEYTPPAFTVESIAHTALGTEIVKAAV